MPRKMIRGRGIFGDAGGWLGTKAGDALGGLIGFGRKRRVKRRGAGPIGTIATLMGLGRKRRVRRGGALFPGMDQFKLAVMPRVGMRLRVMRKRGGLKLPDWFKPIATKAKELLAEKAAQYVGEKVDPRLGRWVQRGAYHLGDTYGFGRRRKRGGAVYNRLLS